MPIDPLSRNLWWVRWFASALGAVAFGAGAVAVFVSDNGPGTVALLVVGAVLMLFPFFEHRIQGLEFGGTKLLLRAEEHQRRAEAAERRGDLLTASRERARSRELLAPLEEEYRWTRRLMEPGTERSRRLEDFMQRAREATSQRPLTVAEVREWLRSSDEEVRVVGLAAMRERSELRDLRALSEVFDSAKSAFEQAHALEALIEMVPALASEEREKVRQLVLHHRRHTFGASTNRWSVSERLLTALADADGRSDAVAEEHTGTAPGSGRE